MLRKTLLWDFLADQQVTLTPELATHCGKFHNDLITSELACEERNASILMTLDKLMSRGTSGPTDADTSL